MPPMQYRNSHEHIGRARDLRKEAPKVERILWKALTALKSETGLKFRHQHPINPYIADFACVRARLIIEIDGPSHETNQKYDAERSRFLEKSGWKVLRFANEDVEENLTGVVEQILAVAEAQILLVKEAVNI